LNSRIFKPQNLKTSKDLKCDNLLITNQDYSGEEEIEWFGIDNKKAIIKPILKWLFGRINQTKKGCLLSNKLP